MNEEFKEHKITHKRSQGLINAAYLYAKEAHGDQKRKYTDEPYIVHPVAVARLVASVTEDCEMISAALLHDVIEDTPKTFDDIRDSGFGYSIATLVDELTDASKPSDGNRECRKQIDREHTAKASANAKTIKLADLIDNTSSIVECDPNFAKTYMREKQLLLGVLQEGNPKLLEMATIQVDDYYKSPIICFIQRT